MPTDVQKQVYQDMIGLYEHADNILESVESLGEEGLKYSKEALEFAETVDKNVEILIENFLMHAKASRNISALEKVRIDKARQEIVNALEKFTDDIGG